MHCGKPFTKSAVHVLTNATALRPSAQSPPAPAFVQHLTPLPVHGSGLLHNALARQPLLTAAPHDSSPLRSSLQRPATLVAQAENAVESVPSSAETARTIVDIVAHGALSTVGEDGVPLGTYASYILDGEGQPVLRLRADAVHTNNLLREPRCSLFVQPAELPARLLARVTLLGRVEPLGDEHQPHIAELHRPLHGQVRSTSRPPITGAARGFPA